MHFVKKDCASCMFVLCVLNRDKSQKYRTIKTKNQVRMKYREQENTKKKLVEALPYKTEGRGFDSRWGYWNVSLT